MIKYPRWVEEASAAPLPLSSTVSDAKLLLFAIKVANHHVGTNADSVTELRHNREVFLELVEEARKVLRRHACGRCNSDGVVIDSSGKRRCESCRAEAIRRYESQT